MFEDIILPATIIVVAIFVIITVIRTAIIVPQQMAYVVERFGRYHITLGAGIHILFPYLDAVRYKFSLK